MITTIIIVLIGIAFLIGSILLVLQDITDYDATLERLGMLERQKEEQQFPLPNILKYNEKRKL